MGNYFNELRRKIIRANIEVLSKYMYLSKSSDSVQNSNIDLISLTFFNKKNRLNKTESAVFKFCRSSIYERPVFQSIRY